jgi:copper(I)-binding protein
MQLAGYATLTNHCQNAATVTSVDSPDFEMAMIHETVIENGISKMRHRHSLVVPANGSVSFSPGGLHLMLMMPARDLKAGDQVKMTFGLDGGGEMATEFPVLREAPAAGK